MVVAGEGGRLIFLHTSFILFVSTIFQNTYNEKGVHVGLLFRCMCLFQVKKTCDFWLCKR
ncbi:hypothetical protein SAMN02982927_00292 [Sporolactobacillus nakayamae]|uniref:Uncharacterized protein n=1 Tax=Sporolactobacillus nakayamae TaxID=269670 RepID=A0A1I2N7E5_9BACL|nr:hypothetical protein SAMN02982927_00292 [Sporolactobacillus nakayamae]